MVSYVLWIHQGSTIVQFHFLNVRRSQLFWTHEDHLFLVFLWAFLNIDPGINKTPKFPNVIGPISAKPHSCFLIDIGLIPKILEILLNDSSSCFGARLLGNLKMRSPEFVEIYET